MLDEVTFEAMFAEWRATGLRGLQEVPAWQIRLAIMREEMQHLRSQGLWRTGGLTLLHELGLHRNEVVLCRGLGWLLAPDGWHGLGDGLIRALACALDLPTQSVDQATVSLEEARGVTRADVVVRFPGACVLIEAKVMAMEQDKQADRLARGWADESPHLVFLTREGREPLSAVETAGQWSCLRWSELASMASDLIAAGMPASPGARDLIATWKHYGG